jgi:8-oxo-dGTP pyrophosphatase MutT (NUDIX family)
MEFSEATGILFNVLHGIQLYEMQGTAMTFRFDKRSRQRVSQLCTNFSRDRGSSKADALKRAAVAIVIVDSADGSEAAFLLTRRSAKLRSHSAQWALPGGRCDADEGEVDAALREVHEELGFHLNLCDVLGILDDYPTRSGYLVTPIIVWSESKPQIRPNSAEIDYVCRIALSEIVKHDAVDFIAIKKSDRPVVRIRVEGNFIHAPTAAILYQFRELLAGRITRVAHLEQPIFAWH